MALTASSTQSHGSWCVQGRTVWREPVRNKPLGSALTRLFCIYRELQLKLWTPTQNKTNEEMSRAPRSVGVSRSDSRKKKSFHCWIFLAAVQSRSSFECMHVLQRNVRNFQHFAKKKYIKMLIEWVRSGRMGKYLASILNARTSLLSVRTSWLRAENILGRPSHSVHKSILSPYAIDAISS